VAANQRLTAILLAVMDTVILLGSGVAATWLRFGSDRFGAEILRILDHPGFVAYAVIVQLLLATTFDLYRPASWRTRDYLLVRLAALAVALMVAFAVGVYLVLTWRFGRGLLAITLILSLPTQGLCRFLWLAVAAMPHPRRAVVIGEGPIVAALQQELLRRPSPPFQIVAHLPTPETAEAIDGIPEALAGADLVVVASLARDETVDHLAALNFRGTTVMDAAGAYAALTGRIPARQVDSRWFIATGDFSSLATSPFHHVQRFFDIIAASALLLITFPVSVLSALAILITSGLPVFYRQQRLGRFGRPFTLIKLRTMRVGSGENGPTFAVANDSRVTLVGRLLRRWRIDELPQLLNVLRGEMSLVGPRPERPDVATRLEREIPFYAFRYSVRPGITGWAQVHLPYVANTEDHEKKLEYDLYLLRHHGPAMYGIVLLRTLGALVFRPGR
jgi:exopolysaccharide biosynthesis polyprenyl glycosylphosphotransferase